MGAEGAPGMWGQAPWTTDLSEMCVTAASTNSAAQGSAHVISLYPHTALLTPADLLPFFVAMRAAVGGVVLLGGPKSM